MNSQSFCHPERSEGPRKRSVALPLTVWLTLALLFAASGRNLQAQVGNDNPTGPAGIFNGDITTAGDYDPYTANVRRSITDIVVAGAVGTQPLALVRTGNSRIGGSYSGGFGQPGGWHHNYEWHLSSNEYTVAGFSPATYSASFPDGRSMAFTNAGADTYFRAGARVRERLVPMNGSGLAYIVLADNTRIEFKATPYSYKDNIGPDGSPPTTFYGYDWTPQAIYDPYGLKTTLTYNANGLYQVTEPAGRWLRFSYVSSGATNFIDTVTASDGRSVKYTYGGRAYSPGTTAYISLDWVTYYGDNSLVSHYTYHAPNIPSYGNYNGVPLLRTCSDAMYSGPMWRIAYVYANTNNPDNTAPVYGQIKSENYYDGTNIGGAVSTLGINASIRGETRGDTQWRQFNYTGNLLTSCTDFNHVTAYQTYDANNYVNSVKDRNGHTTNYTLTALTGNVTQVQFPATPSDAPAGRGAVNYTYGSASCADPNNKDPNNPYYVCTATDEAGHVTTYTRYANKRIYQIKYPDNSYETFAYNGFGEVTSHRMTTGGVEAFLYSTDGLKTQYRDPYHDPINFSTKASAVYQYDSLDRLNGVTDNLGSSVSDPSHTTNYAYNNRGQVTTTTLPIDPNDGTRHSVINAYNNTDGTLASVTDQLAHVTRYTYDAYRRMTSATSPGHGSPVTTYYFHDPNGTGNDYWQTSPNVTWITLPGGERTHIVYDANFRKLSVTTGAGSVDTATTNFVYDNVGNVTRVGLPNEQAGQQFYGYWANTQYDERNRPYIAKDPLGNATSFRYDAYGRKASITRPNGQTVTFNSYDAINRVTQQTATQAPEPAAVTQYTYDPSGGQLQTMTDPNSNVYTYVYDLMNRKTQLWYPADSSNVQRDEIWHYDVANRLDTFTNRAGKVQTLSYDNLNRVTLSNWNDTVTPDVSYSYDAANRVLVIANAYITRNYYNDNLLYDESTRCADNIERMIIYGYDPDGRRKIMTYPNSDYAFNYTYTKRSQLDTIVDNATSAVVANYGYDTNGNLRTRNLDNATSTIWRYDAMDRALSITHTLVGDTRTFGYAYDNVGNRNWVKRDGNLGDVYDYDNADQVITTKLNVANPDTTAPGPQTIVYDATGNRASFAAYGPTDNYMVNGLNQYIIRNSSQAVYDNNGNMTTGFDGSTYTYDAQNRLLSAKKGTTTDTFAYDGLNRQISKKIGTQTVYYRVYDGWDLLGEYKTGTASALWAYLYGPGGLVKNVATNNYY